MISPGYEAVYATDRDVNSDETSQSVDEGFLKITTDDSGNRIKEVLNLDGKWWLIGEEIDRDLV